VRWHLSPDRSGLVRGLGAQPRELHDRQLDITSFGQTKRRFGETKRDQVFAGIFGSSVRRVRPVGGEGGFSGSSPPRRSWVSTTSVHPTRVFKQQSIAFRPRTDGIGRSIQSSAATVWGTDQTQAISADSSFVIRVLQKLNDDPTSC
jgi:hypothetical protein